MSAFEWVLCLIAALSLEAYLFVLAARVGGYVERRRRQKDEK